MAVRRIFVDKTELVLMVPKKNKVVRKSLTSGEIARIQFDKQETKLFGIFNIETEAIKIVSGKLGAPIVYKKSQNKKYFDEYKRELEKFAKDNFVTFADNVKCS